MILSGIVLAQIAWGVQATPLLTHADPIPGGGTLTELRVVAPVLFGEASLAHGLVTLHAMLDGEGWTMRGGELSMGAWGEGFIDRRHPHTWAHELMATAGGTHWSISAGKGFAPFGSEDPMSRPAIIYPVNHHFSQILERAVAIGALRWRAVTIEAGTFNGDEPETWDEWPNWSRFGDSWSGRLTVRAARGLDLGASYADVKSPEHRQGAGLRHRMLNVSARFERRVRVGDLYALAEWDHVDEGGFFSYYSGLAEGQLTRGGNRVYLRVERSDRPEEMRLGGDEFIGVRPHSENSNNGITRWSVITAGAARRFGVGRVPIRFEAIAEGAFMHVTTLTGIFDPSTFYGRNDLSLLSVGLRLSAGQPMHRMGRYGSAMPDAMSSAAHSMPGMTHE